jgi:tetratricopeptide (TPR) repeat protein
MKKIKALIKKLKQITRDNGNEIYAKAQFNLGQIYECKKNLNKAIKSFSNILESDSQLVYSKAQYHLANIYFFHKKKKMNKKIDKKIDKKINKKARNYYNEVKYYSSEPDTYVSARVISELIANKPSLISKKSKLQKSINKIEKISTLVDDIKDKLLVSFKLKNSHNDNTKAKEPERRVAHYTKPAVLFNLLKGSNPSKFRLNIVDFMNDPSENKVLTNWLNITNNPNNEIKSFLASFTFNHNSLNQFRLYGNEENIPGSGVSIALSRNFFDLDTKRSIWNKIVLAGIEPIISVGNKQIKLGTIQAENKSNDTLHPLPLYRCLYFDPKTGYMSLAKRNKQSFSLEKYDEKDKKNSKDDEYKKYINELLKEENKITFIKNKLEIIKDSMSKLLNNKELQKIPNLEQLLSLTVLPISCLIKHAAFEDEDECRMIYITHIADDKIVEPQDYQSTNSLYVEYTHVENYIDNIYLGPNCKAQHELWLQNHIKKKQRGKQIRLIKSEVPLR